MENNTRTTAIVSKGVLQSAELYRYVLETSVYPREPEPLKELRDVTAGHPMSVMGTAPDAGQLMAMLLKLVDAKKTIEVGVFTGYSLLLTALTIPEDGKIIAIDLNRDSFEIGLPVIKRAGVDHKIDFREAEALPVLDQLLKDKENEGSFDYAFVDADKVEHVVREQKIMAAYELLEIYCELIAPRLPMIESQKYMVEKLSATAPDGQTKIKFLSAIAEEHNITWDPDSFSGGDLKPPEDLLNGPNTFGKASEMLPDLPNVPSAPGSHSDKGSSNVQVSPNSNKRHSLPVNFHEQNERSSPRSQTDVGAYEVKQSGAFHPKLGPTGSSAVRMEFRHPYSGQGQPFSSGSQSWNMEFTDATAAAQAAAESAERSCMAARAAAELASRGNSTRRYSTESHRDEESQRYADSTLRNEHHAKGPINNSFHGRNSRTHLEQIDGNQQHDVSGINENFRRESLKSTDKSNLSASLKSNAASVDGNPLENSTWQYSTESHRGEESQRYADSTLRNEHHAKSPRESQEDNSRKQVSMSKADMSTPFSQRTRAPPSNSEKSSYSKTTVLSGSSVSPGYGKERNSSSRTLYNTESRPERLYQNKSSGAVGSSGQSRLAEEAAYKPNSPSKRSTFEESLKSPAKEQPSNYVSKNEKSDSIQSLKSSGVESPSRERAAKSRLAEQAAYMPNSSSKRSTFEESLKSSAKERPSNSVPKNEKSDSTQSLKSSSVESPSKERAAKSRWAEQAAFKPNAPSKRRSSYEESLKSAAKEQPSNSVPKKEKSDSFQSLKSSTSMESPSRERAAHVHQKLPDYDEIAARLQSIRLNRHIGSLGKDMEEEGVQNVTVKNKVFKDTENGLRIPAMELSKAYLLAVFAADPISFSELGLASSPYTCIMIP
ncbi:hypothetical protein LWI29_002597 [Acer saccharum]|uniref:Caffeoyl-CoA O-methyltransferase n=1 Tax=Acer saccharum TaxID=4024 RepID=A0AA39UFS2_ACESA|nr:hypothetical protein LWI29_002597 [Acer saccharum]